MKKSKKIQSFFIESLGCAKNTVDSHSIEKLLSSAGMKPCEHHEDADVIIVNTCGFIQPAKEESLEVLQDFASHKRDDQFLIAAGCMSEREQASIHKMVAGLDAALSTRRWAEVLHVINHLEQAPASPYFNFPETQSILAGPEDLPRYAVQGKSAYLKIADGCDRKCAYCAIPLIKGPMVSRPLKSIIKDAQRLEKLKMQEVILIAQDSTAYGRDLGIKDGLPKLLKSLTETATKIPWFRIMYTFPGAISDDLIDIMRSAPQILPYLDIPLQHAHPDVLRRMHRPSNMDEVRQTIAKMRTAIPNLALRTTFIVGFPGESDVEYAELVRFTEEIQFDHVGLFPYYHESSTDAFQLADDIPESVKNDRINNLARIQESISLKRNQTFIGKRDYRPYGRGWGWNIHWTII